MMTNALKYDNLSARDHHRIAEFVESQAGILLPEHKRGLIETRLRKRQKALRFNSLKDYIAHALEHKNQEQSALIDALTTNKTEFFREPTHYPIFVDIIRSLKVRPVRIWSAGCSNGKEPYTLAMVAAEHKIPVKIIATDISDEMLQHARRAIYPHDDIDPVPVSMRPKYLMRRKTSTTDEVKIAKNIRNCVTFSHFNLIKDAFHTESPFDIIFCRNVMIYFNQMQRKRIVTGFNTALKPGGTLFIGHSETIKGMVPQLVSIAPTVYQRQLQAN